MHIEQDSFQPGCFIPARIVPSEEQHQAGLEVHMSSRTLMALPLVNSAFPEQVAMV